jgi:hypothetical protein
MYMNAKCGASNYCVVAITIGFSVCMTGCVATPFSTSHSQRCADIEGTWSWSQKPGMTDLAIWHGEFVLKKDGNSYTGTLNDLSEATYDDKILDVTVSDNHITFTRQGRFGSQHWEGVLKEEDGVLKIVDGQWKKESGSWGSFAAEKKKG